MMNISEQLLAIGNDLLKHLNPGIQVQVESQVLSLVSSDKSLNLHIGSTHILEGKREYVLICDELENHHYTRLELALTVTPDGSEIEYIDYPPYSKILKHFDK